MKKNKLFIGAIILLVAFIFVRCNQIEKKNDLTKDGKVGIMTTPSTFYYKFDVLNLTGTNKVSVSVRINGESKGHVLNLLAGPDDNKFQVSSGNCGTTANVIEFTVKNTTTGFPTQIRNFYDVVPCEEITSTNYVRKFIDTIRQPDTNIFNNNSLVMWPPTYYLDSLGNKINIDSINLNKPNLTTSNNTSIKKNAK